MADDVDPIVGPVVETIERVGATRAALVHHNEVAFHEPGSIAPNHGVGAAGRVQSRSSAEVHDGVGQRRIARRPRPHEVDRYPAAVGLRAVLGNFDKAARQIDAGHLETAVDRFVRGFGSGFPSSREGKRKDER